MDESGGAIAAAAGESLPRTLGNYELIAKIGDGGMAEVFLARKKGLLNFRKLVVVKTVKSNLSDDPRFIKLLLEEARLSALLKHPKVVDIYDLGLDGDTYFIAMEYLPGQSLTSIIKTSIRKQKRLDVFSSAQIIADAAEGLHAVHNLNGLDGKPLDLVHLDVSPGNILVLYNGHVKLVDFGVSKVKWKQAMVGAQELAFKVGYSAPEQLRGESVSPRSDIFSLGVVMWELLTHRRLYPVLTPKQALARIMSGTPPSPSSLRSETPKDLDAICLRALEIDPDKRFQSAREMQYALETLLRAANRFRESRHIEAFMDSTFDEVRAQHAELIKGVSTGTGVHKLTDVDAAALLAAGRADDGQGGGETHTDVDIRPMMFSSGALQEDLPILTGEVTEVSDASARQAAASTVEVESSLAVETSSNEARIATPRAAAQPSMAALAAAHPVAARGSDDTQLVDVGASYAPVAPNKRRSRVPIFIGFALAAGIMLFGLIKLTDPGSQQKVLSGPVGVAATASGPTAGPNADRDDLNNDLNNDLNTNDLNNDATKPAADSAKPAAGSAADDGPTFEDDSPGDDDTAPPAVPVRPKRDRKRARALYKQGVKAFSRGNMYAAKRALRDALRADPGYAMAHRGLGLVYERSGAKRSAARSFKRYLRAYPRARDAKSIKARVKRLGG